MPYDRDLAQRLREEFATQTEVTERAMFGGLAFLLRGHMTVAASSRGGLMVRVSPQRGTELAAAGGPAAQMEMQGRPMKGWLHLDAADVATDRELSRWVGYAVDYTSSLPPRAKASSKQQPETM